MSTATRVPETHELEGDDALNALHRRGRGRLAKNSFQRFRTAHSLRQPRTAEGAPDIGSPQARGAVDTRDCGSAARTPRQRTRSTASRGPSGLLRLFRGAAWGLALEGPVRHRLGRTSQVGSLRTS